MNSLPGPESHEETSTPQSEGITPDPGSEVLSGPLGAANIPLPPVWRDSQGHDEWCEADWHPGVARFAPCGCGERTETGDYPDGQREPQ